MYLNAKSKVSFSNFNNYSNKHLKHMKIVLYLIPHQKIITKFKFYKQLIYCLYRILLHTYVYGLEIFFPILNQTDTCLHRVLLQLKPTKVKKSGSRKLHVKIHFKCFNLVYQTSIKKLKYTPVFTYAKYIKDRCI